MAKTELKYKRSGNKLNRDFVEFDRKKKTPQVLKLLGSHSRDFLNKETGEMKPTKVWEVQNPDGIELFMIEDGGLKNGLAAAKIGDWLEITYTGQKDLTDGKRCNIYDVYPVEMQA